MNDVPHETYGALLIAAMGGWVVLTTLRCGVTLGEQGVQISRAERPSRFWFEIIGWTMISLACLGFGLWKWTA